MKHRARTRTLGRGYALLVALTMVLSLSACTRFFFHPERRLVLTPDQIGLAYEDVALETADGVKLHGWFLPAKSSAKGNVLFLHGNAENISTHIASVAWLPAEDFNVLLIDYRGYGLSEGSPSLEGLHQDAAAALSAFLNMPEVDPARSIVLGQSLGGAIALVALARSPLAQRLQGAVIEGAFCSYRRIAKEKLNSSWVTWAMQWPLSMTIDDRFRPDQAISQLSPLPVLLVHGMADPVVPFEHSQCLFDAAKEPKSLWLLPDTGHIAAFATQSGRHRLLDYLDDLLKHAPSPADGG